MEYFGKNYADFDYKKIQDVQRLDDKYCIIYWNKTRLDVFGEDGRSNFTMVDRADDVVSS